MGIIGKPKTIHYYDPITGKYVKSYDSFADLEREHGLYRGAVSEILKGKCKKREGQVSLEKHDVHPLFSKAEPVIELPTPPKINNEGLLSEAELRKKHDMFYQVFSFVKGLPEGKFVEETSMLRQLTLYGKPRYKDALSRAELKDFKGKVDGVTYYGASTSIGKLKREGVLQ